MTENVYAVILAAGMSSRMGEAKQLLPLGERSILQHVIDRVLKGKFTKVLAVIGHEAAAVQKTIHIEDKRFEWVVNKDYQLGQSTSLKTGLQQLALSQVNVMIFLGDLPFISEQTIHAIYESGLKMLDEHTEPFMVRPVYQSIPGHPVFLGRIHEELFSRMTGDQGAKSMLESFSYKERVPVEDEGIIIDIDTPEAYQEAKKQNNKLKI
ncbi:nucleotidyltransferase family protein [Pseudobacillus sp. FSL P4-0506]|uniref:nucleotidyltransferase family protein n=1 Tax=unclassified Pseudobacillus TaxID=2619284 RepID=UPI0030FB78AC